MSKKKKPPAKRAAVPAGRWKKYGIRAGITLAALYAGLVAFGIFGSNALIFPAPPSHYGDTLPDLIRIPVPGGGEAAALWLPSAGAKQAILYFHGNGEDLGSIRERLLRLRKETGCAILAVDYPGYGLTQGPPSESGTLRVADAAFRHLVGVRDFAPKDIVLRGYSLGSGPAVDLAARHAVRGVVLEAPFTSTFRVVTRAKLLPFDRFDNLAKIDRVQSPLLIIHGDRDPVIPFEHGQKLHAAAVNAPSRRFIRLPGAGHDMRADNETARNVRTEFARIIRGE